MKQSAGERLSVKVKHKCYSCKGANNSLQSDDAPNDSSENMPLDIVIEQLQVHERPSPILVPSRIRMPHIFVISDSVESSDDDPFASRSDDQNSDLSSQMQDSAYPTDEEFKDMYNIMIMLQELNEDEGMADWTLEEAKRQDAERDNAANDINN